MGKGSKYPEPPILRILKLNEIERSADLTSEQALCLRIHNLYSVIISRVLRILASQNRFISLYDKIFNIDRFVD